MKINLKSFKCIIQSIYDQLSEYHLSTDTVDPDGFVGLADSILRLVFVQLCAAFGLVHALIPLCNVAPLILCFLLNNFCGIAKARSDPFRFALRLLVFVCQTALLFTIIYYGIVYVFYPILSTILYVMGNYLVVFSILYCFADEPTMPIR